MCAGWLARWVAATVLVAPGSGIVEEAWPYAPQMTHAESSGRLARILDAAEAASPVDAVEAVTRELGVALGATEVSFLIADLSGRALVRLAHVPLDEAGDRSDGGRLKPGERRDAEELATVSAVRRWAHGAGGPYPDRAGCRAQRAPPMVI